MPTKTSSTTGSELFIIDNSDEEWKVLRYLHDWCQIAKGIDIASGYFEIGALLALKDEWQKVDEIRILMGDECSLRTRDAFQRGLSELIQTLDASIEKAKDLDRLSPDVARRILRKIQALRNNLAGDVKRLVDFQPAYRLRVGDWRVLFDVTGRTILIQRVLHRSDAY